MGPILRIGENEKAPTIQRPPNRSNNHATFIVLQERDDFCGVRVVLIGKLFEKIRLAARSAVDKSRPLNVRYWEQRKTFAHTEFFDPSRKSTGLAGRVIGLGGWPSGRGVLSSGVQRYVSEELCETARIP
jgi:hypothetical protein